MLIHFGMEYVLFLESSENEEDNEDDEMNSESFGETEVLFDNGDFEVSFDEIHIEDEESALVYFKIYNRTSNPINIWLTDIKSFKLKKSFTIVLILLSANNRKCIPYAMSLVNK